LTRERSGSKIAVDSWPLRSTKLTTRFQHGNFALAGSDPGT
jgi:hypothetical protein